MRRSSNNEPKRLFSMWNPSPGKGSFSMFQCKGLKPPFKTVPPPQKTVTPKFDTGIYGTYFVCLYRGVPVPVSETIWRGKVGTPEKCACIVTTPVSGVPVSDIYCIRILSDSKQGFSKKHWRVASRDMETCSSCCSILNHASNTQAQRER